MTEYNISLIKLNATDKTKEDLKLTTNESKSNFNSQEPGLKTDLDLDHKDYNVSLNTYLALLNRFRRKETLGKPSNLETAMPNQFSNTTFYNNLKTKPVNNNSILLKDFENSNFSVITKKDYKLGTGITEDNLTRNMKENSKAHEKNEEMLGKLKIDDETRQKLFFDFSRNKNTSESNTVTSNIIQSRRNIQKLKLDKRTKKLNTKSDSEEAMGKLKIDDETRSKLFFDYSSTFSRSNSTHDGNKSRSISAEKPISVGNAVGDKNPSIKGGITSRKFSNNSLGPPANLSLPSIKDDSKSTKPSFVDGE